MSTIPKRYTRFELMDTTGRVVVHCGNTQSLEQDECRTLKVFIDQPARAKDAELIQMLVDCIRHNYGLDPFDTIKSAKYYALGGKTQHDALAIAAAAGFTPTEP